MNTTKTFKTNPKYSAALHDAQHAFWAVIAEYYPECEFGDFPPDAHHAFNRACKDAAAVWLEYNLPIITNNSEDK